jgi:hypothetical protein
MTKKSIKAQNLYFYKDCILLKTNQYDIRRSSLKITLIFKLLLRRKIEQLPSYLSFRMFSFEILYAKRRMLRFLRIAVLSLKLFSIRYD